MLYRTTIAGQVFAFDDLRQVMAFASPARSGDYLAGIGAATAQQRMAARHVLAETPLRQFLTEALIPYESDNITRLIIDSHDAQAFAPVSHLTVGDFRNWLLSDAATTATLTALAPGLTPEMAAAVSKLMRNQDLVSVAKKCSVVTRFRDTIGLPGHLSVRLQPNHPTDDLRGVAASTLDGLLYGAGDAVIGLNPASDSMPVLGRLLHMLDEVIQRFEIPTQSCVLTHVTNTLKLAEAGAPVDLVFQSIAGTEKANLSFGVTPELLDEAYAAALSLKRGTVGDNVMYFRPARAARCRPTPTSASTSRPARRAPMRWRGATSPFSSTPWSASSGRSTCTTANRSSAPGWKTTSAASCWACPSAATSATPTTPRPTRTTWTRCSCCWARRASTSSWASRARTT